MRDWSGQQVVIAGAARQGIALARYLSEHGAKVVLNDLRAESELKEAQATLGDLPVSWVCGGHPLSLLDGADCLCISGGVPLDLPLVVAARQRGIPLSNDSQIFLEAAPCKVIGITGSAGKTTTTTLVGRIAVSAGYELGVRNSGLGIRNYELGITDDESKDTTSDSQFLTPNSQPLTPNSHLLIPNSKVWIGGNIGSPLISVVDEIGPDDLAVMELSSFQLEIMSRAPQVAAILNITPNHLDRHGTMEAYTVAKARILEFQTPDESAVLGRDDPGAWSLAGRARGRLFSFGLDEPQQGWSGTFRRDVAIYLRDGDREVYLMPLSALSLRGEHNLLNVLAACAIAAAAGLAAEAMKHGVEGFHGVPHRLEFVRRWGGADWYNDSIATAPERSIAAIRSFTEPLVLLAGGRDKNLPWEGFAKLVRSRVDHLILFGEAAGKIAAAIHSQSAAPDLISKEGMNRQGFTLTCCSSLREAVQAAAQLVEPGDVVLLSPGGTSFDEFKDFEERGRCFVQWVKELA